jgi:hypothetical protein
MTTIIDDDDDFLEYPRKFFHLRTGSGPKNATEAMKWWSSREKRPKPGNMIDDEPPDGLEMLREIATLRAKLRIYIGTEYFQVIRERAKRFGLINEQTGENAVLTKDLKKALSTLENTPENHQLVYNIFFEFHKSRSWMAKTLDKWFISRKMKLQPQPNDGKKV